MGKLRIGIIGIGLMGHAIAWNIRKHGWEIGFLDHPGNQPSEDLVAAGAKVYQTGAALTEASDVVIICVTGSPQVEDVLTREDGVISAISPGKIVMDCSTAIPSSSMRMAELVAAAGGAFLDTPMTRTPKEAAEGRLNLIVGGDRAVFDTLLPLLNCFAENIVYAGAVGAGHTLKLVHNFVSLAGCAIIAEAASVAAKAGIDPRVLYGILDSGGGRSVVLERMKPFLLDHDTSGFRFTIQNCVKDTGYFLTMSQELQGNALLAGSVAQLYRNVAEAGNSERYIPEMIDLV